MDPLSVAYRGNFQPGVPRPWSTETHVAAALEGLGHRVVRLQENQASWADCEAAGRAADVFLWQRTWDIDPAGARRCLDTLKDAGVPTVSYHLDRWWGLERESQVHAEAFFRTALVVTPDDQAEQWAAAGVNHRWMPPAVDAAECGPVPPNRRRWPHDVVFVGSYPYPHPAWAPYRHELVSRLRARYGQRFMVFPQRGRQIRGRDLAELYVTSKVVVGDSCLVGDPCRYTSDRVPETIGRGGFLVHPHVAGVTDGSLYADREHLATYPLGDFDEMLRVVDHYLEHTAEREAIRTAGRAHVAAHHTYAHRMAELLAGVEKARV